MLAVQRVSGYECAWSNGRVAGKSHRSVSRGTKGCQKLHGGIYVLLLHGWDLLLAWDLAPESRAGWLRLFPSGLGREDKFTEALREGERGGVLGEKKVVGQQ